MKRICAFLIVALFILTAGQALAYSYSGAWTVNDLDAGDFFALTVASAGGDSTFYLYDNDSSTNFKILDDAIPNPLPTGWYGLNMTTVYVFNDAGTWYANFEKELTGAFLLGPTPEFKFMFTSGACPGDMITDYNVDPTGSDSFALTAYCPASAVAGPVPIMTVVVSDVTPVPIPGAVLLLGSGLIGLFGIRRRSQRS